MKISCDEGLGRRAPGACRALALAALLFMVTPAAGQSTLGDGRFDELRRASGVWERRQGPARGVVDVVCLVPDVATFLEVVAAWDEKTYFPVLIDDVETSLKFLRAFKPARVVRYSGRGAPVAPADLWGRAVNAVGRAWSPDSADAGQIPDAGAAPKTLGATPPGVVVSEPDSPSLAGAVALAAGRFQPLVRWDVKKSYGEELAQDEAKGLAADLESTLAKVTPAYGRLGDDCDFVTLASDYPYKYANNAKGGPCAFDDLILRDRETGRRWGYAGRLAGGPALSVYRAMCSLFLKPASAILFNTYDAQGAPWNEYTMGLAASKLNKVVASAHRQGETARMSGWHQAFDPVNRHGLTMINTHGGPTLFHPGGQTADTPETTPTALLMIHSFSAEDPNDPQTIAGRWLANGAFLYYGSMNEPFLQAFRQPTLVASCLADNFPVAAAVRRLEFEPFGEPWRLVYSGDPLYRARPDPKAQARLPVSSPLAAWPAYQEFRQPPGSSADAVRLNWSLKMAVFRLQTGVRPSQPIDLAGVLLGIARDRLDPNLRPVYDALLTDSLLNAGRVSELLDRLVNVPKAERSADVQRHVETLQMAALQRAIDTKDFRQGVVLWGDVAKAPVGRDFVRVFLERLGGLADTPVKKADWVGRLRSTLKAGADPANRAGIEAALKRAAEAR